jgi:hypothetical protein
MNARTVGVLQRRGGAFDVGPNRASQGSDDRPPDVARDRPHGGEVAVGGDWESGLDHVDAQAVELTGQIQLFNCRHAEPRCLFAVTQRRIEHADPGIILHAGSVCLTPI